MQGKYIYFIFSISFNSSETVLIIANTKFVAWRYFQVQLKKKMLVAVLVFFRFRVRSPYYLFALKVGPFDLIIIYMKVIWK